MTRFGSIFVSALIFMLSGCTMSSGRAFTGDTVDSTPIYRSLDGQGLGESPGAAWINDNEDLLSFMGRIRRLRIGGAEQDIPAVDFDREGVLIIWMGKKTTSGYNIDQAEDDVFIKDHTAVVTVRWTEPDRDAVLTQRITGPCLMIRMGRGDYSRITVIDQNGLLRAEIEVEAGG